MKFLTKTKGLAPVLLTLGAMVLLACTYVLIYLPKNERKLDEQGFRSLQNIDRNIHAKLDNSAALLNGLLAAYEYKDADAAEINRYILAYPTTSFTLKAKTPVKNIEALIGSKTDSAYIIEVDSTTQQFNLTLIKRSKNETAGIQGFTLGMRFRFEQFIKPLLAEDVFDQYVVFSKDKVMFETFPSGLGIKNEDSLLDVANGLTASAIRNQQVGGVDYKMYLQPVSFDANDKWIMAGLIANERFQHEKNQLPWRVVLLLLTIILTLLVAIPWLKLYQIGSQDRLTTSDGLWSLVVSMLMMSLLFFVMFKYNADYRPDDMPDAKKILAERMKKAFMEEVADAYKRLSAFDSLHKALPTDIRQLTKAGAEPVKPILNDSTAKKAFIAANTIGKNIHLSQVYWLDRDGNEMENWTTDDINAPHGNFKVRSYFQKIDSSKTYQLPGSPTDSFYLDQVVSWTTASFRTIISKKSILSDGGGAKVAVMSFDMKCVDNTVMPAGKSFAIVDKGGKVLYHTQKKRNLNENLLKELSESGQLKSCMEASFANGFRTRYFGKEYYVQVEPLGNLPYFIVIFSDLSFSEMYGMEIFGFTTSMLFLFFLFIMLQLFMVFMVSSKRTFFKKLLFDTSWIGPKISCRRQYALSALLNGFVLILLCAFFHRVSFLANLFILLFAVLFIGLFLNGLFYKKYNNTKRQPHLRYKLKTIAWISALMLLVNFAAFFWLEKSWKAFLLFELPSFGLGLFFYFYGDAIFEKINKSSCYAWYKKRDFLQYFSLMALLRLLITSGMPAVLFYITAYNYEQNLIARYIQHDFAERLQVKAPTNYANLPIDSLAAKGIYTDSVHVSIATHNADPDTVTYSREENATFFLLKLFRFYRSEYAEKVEHFHIPAAPDSTFFFNHMLRDACEGDCGTITRYRVGETGAFLQLRSMNINYRMPDFGRAFPKGAIFWLAMVALVVIFYFIILSVIKKLFAHNLPDMRGWNNFNDLLLQNNQLNNRLFMIGAPGSRKLSNLLAKIKSGELMGGWDGKTPLQCNVKSPGLGNVLISDMIRIPDTENKNDQGYDWEAVKEEALEGDYELIIVDHFEYNIKSREANIEKLNFLERLMLRDRSKIIILSTVHPVNFLDSFNAEQRIRDNTPVTEMSLERWQVLLGHFSIVVLQLEADNISGNTNPDPVIMRETRYTHFLQKMRPTALQTVQQLQQGSDQLDRDAIAYKLQMTAHHFYLYIWQSLTKEEKFLLYDLAEDGLVNSYDDYNLCMLMSKGIIIRYDGTLRLFNHGFRNFILTAIGNNEAMKIKEKITDNGNWGRLKTPIVVVIVALLAFLLASQQETYSRLIAYVTALAAGVPAVFKVFSFFDKNEDKKTS